MSVITTRQWEDGTYAVHGWRKNGHVWCPRCDEKLELYEEVDEFEVYTGKITAWGPGTAECSDCQIAICCSWDTDYVIELGEAKPE